MIQYYIIYAYTHTWTDNQLYINRNVVNSIKHFVLLINKNFSKGKITEKLINFKFSVERKTSKQF